jgi:hypothetical protein
MTMPHLMNCPHMGDGWCLKCVAEAHEQWDADWCDAADWELVRDALDGKPIAPAPGSVPERVASLRAQLAQADRRWREVIDEPPKVGTLVERMAVDSHYTSVVRVTELDGTLAVGHDYHNGYRLTFTLWRPCTPLPANPPAGDQRETEC